MLSTTPYKYINASGKEEEVYSPSNPPAYSDLKAQPDFIGALIIVNYQFHFILENTGTLEKMCLNLSSCLPYYSDAGQHISDAMLEYNTPTVDNIERIIYSFTEINIAELPLAGGCWFYKQENGSTKIYDIISIPKDNFNTIVVCDPGSAYTQNVYTTLFEKSNTLVKYFKATMNVYDGMYPAYDFLSI